MADVAKHTVKIGGKYYAPGAEVPKIADKAQRSRLLERGAIGPKVAAAVAEEESESKKGEKDGK